jgi:hypothetical protein
MKGSDMKLKFVEDTVVAQGRGRKAGHDFAAFIEELYKFPNQWAEFPEKVSFASSAYRISEQFTDIEVVCQGGNALAKSNPAKKNWTVYLRYVPSVPNDKEVF